MPSLSPWSRPTRRRAFPTWLAAQTDRDDAIGQLARMVKPDTGRSNRANETYLALLQQADGRDNSVRETLFEAIVEWGASDG
jgi:thioredoxin-like negative regulator of GroEL